MQFETCFKSAAFVNVYKLVKQHQLNQCDVQWLVYSSLVTCAVLGRMSSALYIVHVLHDNDYHE